MPNSDDETDRQHKNKRKSMSPGKGNFGDKYNKKEANWDDEEWMKDPRRNIPYV